MYKHGEIKDNSFPFSIWHAFLTKNDMRTFLYHKYYSPVQVWKLSLKLKIYNSMFSWGICEAIGFPTFLISYSITTLSY